jgi:UDP-N-acetylmuramyl pentapeptide phosphotransferase/UDP-N-acetylglucosamine-1-phosphate transferase
MDGVNGLSIGYFLIIVVNIFLNSINNIIPVDHFNLNILIQFMSVFLLFNFFSKSFLGDSGSYLISTYMGIYLISYFNHYQELISPFYICLLLWYPAFENFFSIIRRKLVSKGFSTYADNQHLHHYLFKFLNKKIKKNYISNSFSGIIINTINFLFIFLGSYFINKTKPLVVIIIVLILLYLFSYFFLKKNNN